MVLYAHYVFKDRFMLGILRFFLASCVILFHLSSKIPGLGLYAVNCFYVISGYLITLVLKNSYHFDFLRFFFNRFLRLMPTYWVACIFGFVCIYLIPHPDLFHPSYKIGYSFKEVSSNLLLIPWAFFSDDIIISPFYIFHSPDILNFHGYMFRAVTSSWSIAVEVVCYFLLWLIIARNIATTFLCLLLSIIYHWYASHHTDNIIVLYSPFLAAILPFSIGAAGYFISEKYEVKLSIINSSRKFQLLCMTWFILSFLVNLNLSISSGDVVGSIYYYINDILALLVVIFLHKSKLHGKINSFGKRLGDMSYPIFLCQFYFGLVAWYFLGEPSYNRGWLIFTIGYALSFLFSYLCSSFIDNPLAKIRDKVRRK